MRAIMHNIILILHHPSSVTFITLLTFTVDTGPGRPRGEMIIVNGGGRHPSPGTGHVFLCRQHLDYIWFTAARKKLSAQILILFIKREVLSVNTIL